LAAISIPTEQLRMVIFAVSLIVIMLLRPQGIFAHHEFSWSWVRKLLGQRDVPTTELSA
jgi:branched-chain amino acid transport system permease protein